MTVLAAFSVNAQRHPVMLSDLLLSSPAPASASPVVLPSGPITDLFSSDSSWVPSGLSQKLAIAHPHVAVGFAGNPMAGRAALREVRERLRDSTGPLEVVKYFFEKVLERDYGTEDLSLAAMCVADGCHLYGFRCDRYEDVRNAHTQFSDIAMRGSGAAYVYNYLKSIIAPVDWTDPFEPVLHLAGQLINTEARSRAPWGSADQNNLRHYFGGGYEAMVHPTRNSGFRKLSNYLYMFWDVFKDRDELRISDNVGFLLMRYENEIRDSLLMMRYGMFLKRRLTPVTNGLLFIPALLRASRADDAVIENFRSKRAPDLARGLSNVMHFVNLYENGKLRCVAYGGLDQGGIRITETPSHADLEVSDELITALARAASSVYNDTRRAS